MLFDILFVFVVGLISSSCFCTTSVYGLPTSSSPSSSSSSSPLSSARLNIDHHHQHHRQPTVANNAAAAAAAAFADPTSTLRLFRHQPLPHFEYDLGGDIAEMLVGDSNEYSSLPTDDDDDDDTALPNISSFESLNSYVHPLSRKLFVQTAKHLQDEDDNKQAEEEEEEDEKEQRKRSNPPIFNAPASQFNVKSAFPTDPLNSNSIVNLNRLSESTRLSPSLQALVETNPFARAWLTMLLQKVMEEQPVPYIFKYGRRRK